MSSEAVAAPQKERIRSLDQLRGYAIFGMLLVNFFGHYDTKWVEKMSESWFKDFLMLIFGQQLHHHSEFFTYADTIAPLFMFVVGIGLRLSWLRRVEQVGPVQARKSIAKRYFTLVLIAFAIYQGWLWDALMSIGLAGLVAVLVIDRKPAIRIAYAVLLVTAYQIIFSNTTYGDWLLRMGKFGRDFPWPFITTFIPLREDILSCQINGGLLGHWGWAMMLILGTVCYDLMMTRNAKKILTGLVAGIVVFAVAAFTVRAVGTKHYYKTGEPLAAACMVKGDWGMANQMIGKAPGMFAARAKGNPEAEAALEKRDVQAFAAAMGDKIQSLADMKLYGDVQRGRVARFLLMDEGKRAAEIAKQYPEDIAEAAQDKAAAEQAIQSGDMEALVAAIGKDRLKEMAHDHPRTVNEWVFSKNYVTAPFALWSTALGLLTLLLFYVVVDRFKINVPFMAVIGMNPLFIYIFQSLTLEVYSNLIKQLKMMGCIDIEETQSAMLVFGSFIVYFGFIYAVARYFYEKKIIIKL